MAQAWTQEYYESQVQSCRLHIGLAFVQWSNDTKYLVHEEERPYIEEEFWNIYEWLNNLNYHPYMGRFNIRWCYQRMDTLMRIINLLKNDRCGA